MDWNRESTIEKVSSCRGTHRGNSSTLAGSTTIPHMTSPNSESDQDDGSPGIDGPGGLPKIGRLLGLDYGTKRVGLAISTPEQTIASPLETYSRKTETHDSQYLTKVAREHRIVGIVVGLPMHTGGEEGIKAREAREFGEWVSTVTK